MQRNTNWTMAKVSSWSSVRQGRAGRNRECCPSALGLRLDAAGRLTRPKHWQEFIALEMAHTPLNLTNYYPMAAAKRKALRPHY